VEAEVRDRILADQKGPLVVQCTANVPYIGCYHEPNYWLLKDSSIYPLYISGDAWSKFRLGEQVSTWLEGIEEIHLHRVHFLEVMEGWDRYDDWDVRELENWHLDNYNVLNMITAVLTCHELPTPIWRCSVCKKDCRGLAKFLGYRGNGGIGIFLEDPVCDDCFHDTVRWCEGCCRYINVTGRGWCPHDTGDLDEDAVEHRLHLPDDQAEAFGLTGRQFLGPDGDAEGLRGVSIVIMQKGVDHVS